MSCLMLFWGLPCYCSTWHHHAKSLQSCPTLGNLWTCSLSGASVHEDSLGKYAGVSFYALLQGIFPTQGSNPHLLCLLPCQMVSDFSGGSEGKICLQRRRPGFGPWVGKTQGLSRRRKWQPTPVFLPGKSHGWRSLAGFSLWGCKKSNMTGWLHFTSVPLAPARKSTLHNFTIH